MKRIIALIVLCMPLMLKAQDRKLYVYPSLGINVGFTIPFPLSDIPDGTKATPKINPSMGLGFEYIFSDKWNLGFEISHHVLAFSAKADVRSQSFYFNNQQQILYFTGHTDTNVRPGFFEFPITAIYKISPRRSILLGTFYSRIHSGSFKTEGTDGMLSDNKSITDAARLPGIANTSYNFNNFLNNRDAGLNIGYRYRVSNRFNLWGNLKAGPKSIFIKEFNNIDYEMYQIYII
jgi:hypothetical protein